MTRGLWSPFLCGLRSLCMASCLLSFPLPLPLPLFLLPLLAQRFPSFFPYVVLLTSSSLRPLPHVVFLTKYIILLTLSSFRWLLYVGVLPFLPFLLSLIHDNSPLRSMWNDGTHTHALLSACSLWPDVGAHDALALPLQRCRLARNLGTRLVASML